MLNSLGSLIKEIEEGPSFISRILSFFGSTLEKRALRISEVLLDIMPVQGVSFSIKSEYFLGIEGTKIFQSEDSNVASLYVINGTCEARGGINKDQPCREAVREDKRMGID